MRTLLAVLSTALVAIVACGAASKPSQPAVRLKILAGSPVANDVFLNGQGPYRFLLDTGAQTNLVDMALARKLGIPATFQTQLITAAGRSPVEGARVGQVSLGPAEATDQKFLFSSLDGVHALSPDIRGVLGQEFLAHFDYTLDFQNRQVLFGEPPSAGCRVPVRFINGRMAVATSQGDLVLDSGIGTLLLFRASSRPAASAEMRASSGLTASVSIGQAPSLQIGDRQYHPEKAAFGLPSSTSGDGLLPASLFHAIFISNSEGYVVVDPEIRR